MLKSKNGGVYAPSYYENFKCTADKCSHSCCTDWEICIDADAYAKYKRVKKIRSTVIKNDDGWCFKLKEDGRCPHLNADGLCDIIIEYGEDMLCEICKNHPRFFNRVCGGRIEAGVGIACEEACRLVLFTATPFALVKIEELDEPGEHGEQAFDALPFRDRIIGSIENGSGFDEIITALSEEYELPDLCVEKWIDRLLHLEILDKRWARDLTAVREVSEPSTAHTDKYDAYHKRLLTYFVYRHVSVARGETDLKARLAFAVLSTIIVKTLFERNAQPESAEEDLKEQLLRWTCRYSSEIEYSDDNTDELIFALASRILNK